LVLGLTDAQKHATAAFESWLDVGPKIQHTEADPLRSQRRVKWEDYMSAGINFEVDADEKKFDDFLTGESGTWIRLKTDLEKWGGYNMKGLRVLSEAEILAKSSQAGTELRNSVYPASREGEKTIPGSEPPQTEDKM
jgi:hypothetical protein